MYSQITAIFMVAFLFLAAPSLAIATSGNTFNQSFNKAKKILLHEVYADRRLTFYCGSEFNDQSKILAHSGGYQPRKEGARAHRIEWEHIVPAHAFGQSFPEWREGHLECIDSKGKPFKGRNCAEKMNIPYRYMQADMHNLVPAIGELNGLRSNYSFAMLPGGKTFGACEMKIEERKAEPPARVRGDIARTYFYMDAAYPDRGVVGNKNRMLFQAWDREDPVDAWECTRSQRVEKLQGNQNIFVKAACQEKGMW
jgi:deoxyribonuclease I